MASSGTLTNAQSSGLGPFSEVTSTATITVVTTTTGTTATFAIPSGFELNPYLPVSVTALQTSTASIQGNKNSLPAFIGVGYATIDGSSTTWPTTLTVQFYASSTGSVTIPSGQRFLIVQNQGI